MRYVYTDQSSARHRAIRNSYCHSKDSFLSKARCDFPKRVLYKNPTGYNNKFDYFQFQGKMWLLLPFWFFCHLAPVLSESSCQHETQTKYALPNRMIFGKISNLDPTPYPTPQHHHHQTVKVRGLPPDVQWTALRINNMVFLQNDLHNWKSIPQVQRHDQRIVWLWLRTEPARLLDKIKVHCSWQRNDGEKGGEALPIISLRPNWKCQSKQYSPARLVIKCNLMPWYGCDAPPHLYCHPRWIPMNPWTLGAHQTVDAASGYASELRWWWWLCWLFAIAAPEGPPMESHQPRAPV